MKCLQQNKTKKSFSALTLGDLIGNSSAVRNRILIKKSQRIHGQYKGRKDFKSEVPTLKVKHIYMSTYMTTHKAT